jgi:hypothetical protein
MPNGAGIAPPFMLMISTSSGITLDAPWSTIGKRAGLLYLLQDVKAKGGASAPA